MIDATYLGIDLGIGRVRAVLCDGAERTLADASVRLACSAPQPGWREQSPEEWWHATLEAVARVRADAPAGFARLSGIGVAGQTQGMTLLDKHDRLLRPAMLGTDARARAECVELEAMVTEARPLTGNLALPGCSAPKLLWLQKYERSVFDNIAKVLMPKDFIVFRLTGEFVTDMSDASATLCFDVARRAWSARMIHAVGLTPDRFPRLAEGCAQAGELRAPLAEAWGVKARVPVAAGAARPAAAALGLGAIGEGAAYVSLGPSGLSCVTVRGARPCPERAVRNFAHGLPGLWHQLGVTPACAAGVEWWANVAGLPGRGTVHAQAEAAAREAMDEAPVFLPYLDGAGTPHDDARAAGVFFGLTARTTPAAFAYALLEGVAFSIADGLAAIRATGTRFGRASLIGEGGESRFWCALLATASGLPLDRHAPEFAAAGAGAVRLARLAAGEGEADALYAAPPVVETVLPRDDWREDLDIRHARFRRLYRALKAEFAFREPEP